MKFEASSFELDPSYDPERPDGDDLERVGEHVPRDSNDKEHQQPGSVPVFAITAPGYSFDGDTNPYAFNATNPQPISPIADVLDHEFEACLPFNDHLLIRAVQSGKHGELTRDQLLAFILANGSDYHDRANEHDMHAAHYTIGAVESILGGFHVWKPRCEEQPQYIADLWLVFDEDAFDNITYAHPRHHVTAHDRWHRRKADRSGLKTVFVVN